MTSVVSNTGTSAAAMRRHDLDALRAFAMLLGIALHISLTFFPTFWAVQDSRTTSAGWYDEFFFAVHGFRMPLFFMLSGYFTVMLWRRRGFKQLLWHRIRRIGFPLLVALLTIVPLVNWVSARAVSSATTDNVVRSQDIWGAAALGDTHALDTLIDKGVDLESLNKDGATPLVVAVFFGQSSAATTLVDAGAIDIRPAGGDWADISFWSAGAGLLVEEEATGLNTWLNQFHHLWFLWFLLWMIVGLGLVVGLGFVAGRTRIVPRDSGRRRRSWPIWLLLPLTLVFQLQMGDGGTYPVFGPDTSTGLIPASHVLGYYGVFFAFGALLFDQRDRRDGSLADSIGRYWKAVLPLSLLVVLPVGLAVTFGDDPSWEAASVMQVIYVWGMTTGLVGLFRRSMSTQRRGVRYMSDASYWMYLAHLPLVIAIQSMVRSWDSPASAKFLFIFAMTSAILLSSYQWLVRYTPIGTALNGSRARPSR